MLKTTNPGIEYRKPVSNMNKGITKEAAWNIIAVSFDVKKNHTQILKINMIREFGEFLPKELIPKDKKNVNIKPIHQEPIF